MLNFRPLAKDTTLCSDTETTTLPLPKASSTLGKDCSCSSTVSAEVTQPVQARQSLRLTVAVALSVALIRLGCSNGFTQDCDGVRKSSRSVNFTAPENAIDT